MLRFLWFSAVSFTTQSRYPQAFTIAAFPAKKTELTRVPVLLGTLPPTYSLGSNFQCIRFPRFLVQVIVQLARKNKSFFLFGGEEVMPKTV